MLATRTSGVGRLSASRANTIGASTLQGASLLPMFALPRHLHATTTNQATITMRRTPGRARGEPGLEWRLRLYRKVVAASRASAPAGTPKGPERPGCCPRLFSPKWEFFRTHFPLFVRLLQKAAKEEVAAWKQAVYQRTWLQAALELLDSDEWRPVIRFGVPRVVTRYGGLTL